MGSSIVVFTGTDVETLGAEGVDAVATAAVSTRTGVNT
jgi:hypothetical protein